MLTILKKRTIDSKERWSLIEIDGRPIDVRILEDRRASRLTLSLVPASRRGEQFAHDGSASHAQLRDR